MIDREKTRELLLLHIKKYPSAKAEDVFKFIHQSTFGCEHLVSSYEAALSRIESERETLAKTTSPLVEALDGEYSRVGLTYLERGLSVETFAKLFVMSSTEQKENALACEHRLDVAEEMIGDGFLQFSLDEFKAARREWSGKNFPALHHSNEFRSAYCPSYRVISNRFVPFLPLFARLDADLKCGSVLLAVEGGSASGKTTLGEMLQAIYGCTVFHMDDYFLPPEKRTSERLNTADGNVDHERFEGEILSPINDGARSITHRRFDCSSMTLKEPTETSVTPLTVVEGAYSMHPSLCDKYDISVFLDISPEKQKIRIEKRNSPQFAKRFFEEWIPLENKYFDAFSTKEKCDIVIEI